MDVSAFFCVVISFVRSVLAMDWSSVQGVLRNIRK
jgi:hypothetical protein